MLAPPSFIHFDTLWLEVLCLSLSWSHSQISFQTEPTEAWSCIPNHEILSVQKKKGWRGKSEALKKDGEMLSKCYLAISRATSKKRCRKQDIDELFWGRPSRQSQPALFWRTRSLTVHKHNKWAFWRTQAKNFSYGTKLRLPHVTGPLEGLQKWDFCYFKENVKLIS